MKNLSGAAQDAVLETDRLLLRPWRESEAEVWHRLWTERDRRVPPHRRLDRDGRPTVDDIETRIREAAYPLGLLAAERKGFSDIIGYCGLIDNTYGSEDEPELAFELLKSSWRQGYATEASWAVIAWAQDMGYRRLWATVREWNVASLRVLDKLDFTDSGRVEPDAAHGNTHFLTKVL